MRRLANPQNLVLHLGEAFEPKFDGKIAARDHHRQRLVSGRFHDDFGQVRNRARCLDLGDEADFAPIEATPSQLILNHSDVPGGLDERGADQIGVGGDEVEVGTILIRNRVEAEIDVGNTSPF